MFTGTMNDDNFILGLGSNVTVDGGEGFDTLSINGVVEGVFSRL